MDMPVEVSMINEKETVKKLKRELEGWREVILHLHSVLLWEKAWYPAMIGGISTTLFIVVWMMEPSLLSAVSSGLLLVTLLDYSVPALSTSLFDSAQWTGAKEQQFEDICKVLAHLYTIGSGQLVAFKDLKTTSPKLYYSVTITSLALLAYIGNKINNLVLTYLLVTTLFMLPGLNQHGILHKYYQLMLHSVANLLRSLQGRSGGSGDSEKLGDKLKKAK